MICRTGRSEMSLPPLVPNFRNLANCNPVSYSRIEAYREQCNYANDLKQNLEKFKIQRVKTPYHAPYK